MAHTRIRYDNLDLQHKITEADLSEDLRDKILRGEGRNQATGTLYSGTSGTTTWLKPKKQSMFKRILSEVVVAVVVGAVITAITEAFKKKSA